MRANLRLGARQSPMQLPFTESQFLEVFGAYNVALWPVVVGLWFATLAFAVALLLRPSPSCGSAC